MNTRMATCTVLLALAGLLASPIGRADTATDIPDRNLTMDEVAVILRAQAAELREQRALLEEQQRTIAAQRRELDSQRQLLATLPSGGTVATPAAGASAPAELPVNAPGSEVDKSTLTAVARTESDSANKRSADDPLVGYDPTRFTGAIPLPGTSAALRVGGFVKANVVQSSEALGIQDRFIVGSIPTDDSVRGDAEASITARQSRLSFELRENSELGQLRAFVEGDFAGDGDTFRLRHAFGQYRDLLAGKTWSTFMDTDATPEEVDFEGVNGRILSRRTQFRYFPSIGRDWSLAVALEDPDVVIGGGDGLSQVPDLVLNAKRSISSFLTHKEWHVKGAALLRNIRARPDADPTVKGTVTGWAMSLSGSTSLRSLGERDRFMMQLNYGAGYSEYVNDLATVGVPSATFNPISLELNPVVAFAWYAAAQHWWTATMRSNFIYSAVHIDNEAYDSPDAYDSTWRLSGNLIWSPTPRLDVGAELLWGERQDKDGASGDAGQLQVSLKYLF